MKEQGLPQIIRSAGGFQERSEVALYCRLLSQGIFRGMEEGSTALQPAAVG